MKALAQSELLDLLPPDESQIIMAEQLFYRLFPDCRGWLAYGVKEGFLHVVQVRWSDEPRYMLWFEVAPDGRFVVHAVQALIAQPGIEYLLAAGLILARKHNCQSLEIRTKRAGLVRQLKKYNFQVQSVVMNLPI